jgi:hypothetical protein
MTNKTEQTYIDNDITSDNEFNESIDESIARGCRFTNIFEHILDEENPIVGICAAQDLLVSKIFELHDSLEQALELMDVTYSDMKDQLAEYYKEAKEIENDQ